MLTLILPSPLDERAGRCFRKPIFGNFTNMPPSSSGAIAIYLFRLFLALIICVSVYLYIYSCARVCANCISECVYVNHVRV